MRSFSMIRENMGFTLEKTLKFYSEAQTVQTAIWCFCIHFHDSVLINSLLAGTAECTKLQQIGGGSFLRWRKGSTLSLN